MHAVQAYLERVWGEAAARFRLLAENTERGARAMTDAAAHVLRRGLLGRARVRRVDRADRDLVAARSHRDRRRPGRRAARRVGGRIFERTAEGAEHDWGEVTVWEPPDAARLPVAPAAGTGRDATEVDIRFVARRRRRHPGRDRAPGLGTARAPRPDALAGPQPRRLADAAAALPSGRSASRGDRMMGAGHKDDPWVLKTPPGTSEYTMYRDEAADPPALVCQVGSTTLKYHLRAIEDLHAWLVAQAAGCRWARPTSRRRRRPGRSRPGAGPRTTPSAAGTGCARATAAGSACTCPRCSRQLGLAELTHDARNNTMRAR